jgi:hypothetical protein
MCFAFREHIDMSLDHTINLDEVVFQHHKSATRTMDNTSSSASRKRNAADEIDGEKRKAAKINEERSTKTPAIQGKETIVIDSDHSETNTDSIAGTSSTRKRAASSTREDGPSKAPKKGKDDSPNKRSRDDMSEADRATAAGSVAEMSETEKKLQKAQKKIEELKAKLREVDEERHDWRNQALEWEEDNDALEEKLKRYKENGSRPVSAAFSQKIEATIKGDYDEKLKKEQQKFDKMIKTREARHEKLIKDEKALRKKKEDELKAKINDLKEDHKDELQKYKPEHSSTVKEKERELKEKDVAIAKLEKDVQTMKDREEVFQGQIDTCKNQVHEVMDLLRNSRKDVDRLEKIAKKQSDDKKDLFAKIQSLEDTYNNKLTHEGERWKIQNNIAEQYKAELQHSQRANFILRQGKKVAENKNEGLQAEMKVMTEKHDELMKGAELFGGGVGVLKQPSETGVEEHGDKATSETFLASIGADEKDAQNDGMKATLSAMAPANDDAAETGTQDDGDKTAPSVMAPNTHCTAEDGMQEMVVPSNNVESPIVGSSDELVAAQCGIS